MLEPWKMEPIGRIIKEYVPWLKKKCTLNARLLVLPVRNFNIRQDNICGIWQGKWHAYSSAKTEIAVGALVVGEVTMHCHNIWLIWVARDLKSKRPCVRLRS